MKIDKKLFIYLIFACLIVKTIEAAQFKKLPLEVTSNILSYLPINDLENLLKVLIKSKDLEIESLNPQNNQVCAPIVADVITQQALKQAKHDFYHYPSSMVNKDFKISCKLKTPDSALQKKFDFLY